MLKMYPTRYKGRRGDNADIAVLFGEERNKEVAALNPGDWVEFEATMSAHGYRGDPEVMVLWHIAPIPRPSPLSSSAGALSAPEHQELVAHGNTTAPVKVSTKHGSSEGGMEKQ